jgi:hypothetical protein
VKSKRERTGVPKESAAFSFRAVIGRQWVLYCVDVPVTVIRAMKVEGKVPVVFTMNGSSPRRTTMTPRAEGGHRLHVHSEVRREVGAQEGDRVAITLRVDDQPRGVDPPSDLERALREADALEAFRAMGPAMQRELVAWIDQAKREETRDKRIVRVVERACEKREKALDAMGGVRARRESEAQ